MKIEIDGKSVDFDGVTGTLLIFGQGFEKFPGRRLLNRLSREHLGGKLEDWERPVEGPTVSQPSVHAIVSRETKREELAAFFAAMLIHCKAKKTTVPTHQTPGA